MKPNAHLLALALATALHAQNPAPVPAPKPPQSTPNAFSGFTKPLKDQVEVVPFAWEMPTVKFKPRDKAVPDELRVSVNGLQIQLAGVKKSGTGQVEGELIAHYGKLVLISAPAPQSGKLLAKEPYVPDGTHYGLALELATGTIQTSMKKMSGNVTYDWSVRTDGTAFVFEMTKDGQIVNSVQATAADVKAFGFFSTVRYPGNKADLKVTVNPSSTVK